VHLAAGRDDAGHLGADAVSAGFWREGGMGLGELTEGRGVEIETLDIDADLVGPELRAGIEAPRSLREGTGGFDHPVQAQRRSVRTHAASLRDRKIFGSSIAIQQDFLY
jgi:hypothetical protein